MLLRRITASRTRADGRIGAHEQVGPVLPAFLAHELDAGAGFVGLLVLAEDLRPHDALLKDPQGLERGVAAGGFGELLEGQEQGDGAEDRPDG